MNSNLPSDPILPVLSIPTFEEEGKPAGRDAVLIPSSLAVAPVEQIARKYFSTFFLPWVRLQSPGLD